MGKAIPVIIVVVFAVYALFDVIATPKERVRYVPKALWAIIALVPAFGVIMWLLVGKDRTRPTGPPRPSRPVVKGPDDDPDFLRGL